MDCHKLLVFYPFRAVSATIFHSFMHENAILSALFYRYHWEIHDEMSYLECRKNNKIRKTSSAVTNLPDLYFRYSFTLFSLLTACTLCTSDWKALIILTKEFFLLFLHHFPLDMHWATHLFYEHISGTDPSHPQLSPRLLFF